MFCPGPVDTNFNKVADVQFALKGLSSEYVAKYTTDKRIFPLFLAFISFKYSFVKT